MKRQCFAFNGLAWSLSSYAFPTHPYLSIFLACCFIYAIYHDCQSFSPKVKHSSTKQNTKKTTKLIQLQSSDEGESCSSESIESNLDLTPKIADHLLQVFEDGAKQYYSDSDSEDFESFWDAMQDSDGLDEIERCEAEFYSENLEDKERWSSQTNYHYRVFH